MPNALSKHLYDYGQFLLQEEKSPATVEKYMRDVRGFLSFLEDRPLNKNETIAYKSHLAGRYAPASVNSMLASLNSFLRFISEPACCVRQIKVQRQIFRREERELTAAEYRRLLQAAGDTRLSLVIQTICCTGIRISELQYITAEAVRAGKATVNCKNKTRVIFIPASLQALLRQYIRKTGRPSGAVFVSKNGNPLNRSNIWRDMKRLCAAAGVSPAKVFPHNLRHLFAQTFYTLDKDVVRLADLLGHSNVNTTRIYTMDAGYRHADSLEQVRALLTT